MLAGLWLAGCASSRLTQEPGLVTAGHRVDASGPSTTPTVSVILHTRQLRFDAPVGSYFGPHWANSTTQKRLEQVLGEFPFLQPAAPDAARSPYRLVIEATHATSGNKRLSTISSFTKYLIPCSEQHAVELVAVLLRGATPLKTYQSVGTYTTKRHLVFLLLPMRWGLRVAGDTTTDTFRDLFLQLQRDAGTLLADGSPR